MAIGSGLRGKELQAILYWAILTDHESVTVEEMREKSSRNESDYSAWFFSEPASAGEFINSLANTGNVLLATDGCITIGDMLDKGHMDNARAVVAEEVTLLQLCRWLPLMLPAYRLDHKLGGIALDFQPIWCCSRICRTFRCKQLCQWQETGERSSFASFCLPRRCFTDNKTESCCRRYISYQGPMCTR